VDAVPGDELGRVGARHRRRRAAEREEVEVVGAATAAAARRQRPVAETVQRRGRDGLDHGAVDVGVEEGRQGRPAIVAPPELPQHRPQHVVVVLGEHVEPRDAAGGWVVVARTAREQRQLLRLTADW